MQISRRLCFTLSVSNYTGFVRIENLNLAGWGRKRDSWNAIQCTNTGMNNSAFTARTTIPEMFLAKFVYGYLSEIREEIGERGNK